MLPLFQRPLDSRFALSPSPSALVFHVAENQIEAAIGIVTGNGLEIEIGIAIGNEKACFCENYVDEVVDPHSSRNPQSHDAVYAHSYAYAHVRVRDFVRALDVCLLCARP